MNYITVDTINEFQVPKQCMETKEDLKAFNGASPHELVKAYVKTHKQPRVVILTPCYGGLCHTNFVQCLLATIELCETYDIKVSIQFLRSESLIVRGRNSLLAKTMDNPDNTHFMFIDSDISWNPSDILSLIISDKELIGGAYPLKRYDWSKIMNLDNVEKIIRKKNHLINKGTKICDEDILRYNMVKYNFNHESTNDVNVKVVNNLMKVRHIATGFMMLKRELITKMHKSYPETKYNDDIGYLNDSENKFLYALFDCGIHEGHYLSEDWLFCDRWRKIGGEVFLDISINLTHTGSEDYIGSFINSVI